MSQIVKILGLDLGTNSIGWALVIETNGIPTQIVAMGSRIIPLSPDECDEFSRGNAISKNMNRTLKRTIRKGYDRYDLRRKALKKLLSENGMMPDNDTLLKIPRNDLFELRSKALTQQVTLQQLGRILLHLNQRRGYKSSRKDDNSDKSITEYEEKINDMYSLIRSQNQTVGQYFYEELSKNPHFRVKEKVFPRQAYIQEFKAILDAQSEYYPTLLTDELKDQLKDNIIYYQRRLKSQKGQVSFCEFEGRIYDAPDGKRKFAGPRVAPQSSPLAQICKIWESINNITIKNRRGEDFVLSREQKQKIFEYLDTHERISQPELLKLLGLGKGDGYYTNALIAKKGLSGNVTKSAFLSILKEEEFHPLLKFDLRTVEYNAIDEDTAELMTRKSISPAFEDQPLYKLWHTVYSISDEGQAVNTLVKKFNLPEHKAAALAKLDLTKGGHAKKSVRAMRKILPYLQEGFKYSDACLMAGYNHSDYLTNAENLNRKLVDRISLLEKNSLRQPVVEKILNQMINLVNAIMQQYGRPDEIRIELARELKQSQRERNETFKRINETERYHEKIKRHLSETLGKKKITRRDIERYKLWEEFEGVSPYEPSKYIGLAELFSGAYDIEHIIPKSRLFDDSFGNKTICPRHLNSGQSGKNKLTAYDFMCRRSPEQLEEFLRCIENNKRLSRSKREKLLMSGDKIPVDFIARQLRETQYIARKAREILYQCCHYVHTTSGKVTETLRRLWGWDDVISNLQLPKYRSLGKTEWLEQGNNGSIIRKEVIIDWNKRDDHRHHAIDALVVACTEQGFIQRLNTLNSEHTQTEIFKQVSNSYNQKLSLLDNYLSSKRPFTHAQVEEAVSSVLVSFKPGKKVATFGIRKIKKNGKKFPVQTNILVPRGPLSEESVYGKINKKIPKEVRLGPSFTQVNEICDKAVRHVVKKRLADHGNNPAIAFKNLQNNPLYLDDQKAIPVDKVTIWTDQPDYVIKYPVQNITFKDLNYIVDDAVRKAISDRLALFGNNHKEAYKNLDSDPIYLNKQKGIIIRSVRCYTSLNVVEGIEVEDKVQQINYVKYVKPGSNHHIAIYRDINGKRREHVVTFWHAVERRKYGMPVVIKNPKEVWDVMLFGQVDNQGFLSKLPHDSWVYETSMQQNEMFVFNMQREEVERAIEAKDYKAISENLFRVRKLTAGSYWFNHHCETSPRESLEDKKAARCIQASLSGMNGIKVRINNLGILTLEA